MVSDDVIFGANWPTHIGLQSAIDCCHPD